MPEPPASPYIGLARRYRPQQFADLIGQDQIAHSLGQQVHQHKAAQAYLFSGPRGVGKTSAARILAKALNCAGGPTPTPCGKCEQCVSITSGNSMDVIEIDGASNRSIDDIRDLQETISQNPFAARKKIYIIDEVHMLTREAFNALLKTLEEPPPFVVFIFATTALERIPETIKSRCQLFQFNRISMEDIIRLLERVAEAEAVQMDPGERRAIFEAIALTVDGGARDALMSLDQLAALSDGRVRLDDTVRFLGVVEHDLLIRTVELLQKRDTKALLEMVNYLVERGRDLERYVKNLLSFLRDLMILKSGGGKDLVNLTGEKLERAQSLLWAPDESGRRAEALSYPALLNYLQIFLALEEQIKEAVQVRVHLEFAFVKLTAIEPVVDIAYLLEELDKPGGNGGTGARRLSPEGMGRDAATQTTGAAPKTPSEAPPRPSTPDLFGGPSASTASTPARPAPASPVKPKISEGDPAALWQAVLAQRERLGPPLSVALAECRCLGIESGRLKIGISKKSLALQSLQTAEKRARIESILRDLTGQSIQLEIHPLPEDQSPPAPAPSAGAGPSRRPSPPANGNPGSVPPPTNGGPSSVPCSRPAADTQPVLRRNTPSPPSEEEPYDAAETDTYSLYLAQNPPARVRETLRTNDALRDKVDMIRRFFDGRLLDTAGREIVL